MEFQYLGGNCIVISTKNARLVIDDNLTELGMKPAVKPDDIAVYTSVPEKLPEAKLVFCDPGEYEVSDISIFGLPSRSHIDEEGNSSATIYKIQYADLKVAVAGHIHPDVSEDHLEELGAVDVLFIPVGGNGYTLDSIGALSVIKKIDPRIVIPTHFDDPKLKYPVPQQPLAEALKGLSMEPKEVLSKFKPKPADFAEGTQLIVLERV